MDYAAREYFLTFRRLVGAGLAVSLLVAFWAERPAGSASYPQLPPEAVNAARAARAQSDDTPAVLQENPPATEQPAPAPATSTSLLGWVRRPWLGFYTLLGAPPVTAGKFSDAEAARFRSVVGLTSLVFFTASGVLWWRGRRLIERARKT